MVCRVAGTPVRHGGTARQTDAASRPGTRPMSDTGLRNTDIDAALNEAKEAYVTSAPRSLARYVEATTVMPGGNTRTVLHYAPFPLAMARREGCRMWDADGARIHRLPRRIYRRPVRPLPPGDPRGAGPGAGQRHQLRRRPT